MLDPSIKPIAPAEARYIKLGAGGTWEASSLDQGRIYWGSDADNHEHAEARDWTAARALYIQQNALPSTATSWTRELREFYTLGADTLWITFARDHLWWAFAQPEVVFVGAASKAEGSRYRRTIEPLRNTDIYGRTLSMHTLSSKLTQLAAYRQTICSVGAREYLERRINGIEEPVLVRSRAAHGALVTVLAELILELHWADFEVFVDLLFTQLGWRRVSALGGSMKDNDLILEQPATGERASVQVKSRADQGVLDACIAAFTASPLSSRFFFVCHSGADKLRLPADASRPLHVLGCHRSSCLRG
jgi:hypothetical protein